MHFPKFSCVFSPRLKIVLTAGLVFRSPIWCWIFLGILSFFLALDLFTPLLPPNTLAVFYVQEAFHVTKMAFRHFKIRVRKSLTPSCAGSNDFEDAVSDYIICHLDLYDSQSSVNVSVGSFIGTDLLQLLHWMLITEKSIQCLLSLLIAYGERCRICDLWRRFNFGTRDQAWSLKNFCAAEFY